MAEIYMDLEYGPQLATSLGNAGTELAELHSTLTTLIDNINSSFETFKSSFATSSEDITAIKQNLDSVAQNVEAGSWRGTRAEEFIAEYESLKQNIDAAMNAFNENQLAFENLVTKFTEEITPVNSSVEADSTYCSEESTWVNNYVEGLHQIEGN